ncbi:Protein MAIN-LIKE 1 [Glycine max]|nr:Protein MAIN-LIKE 1 [Glycine max]
MMMLTNCVFLYTSIQERPELKLSFHRRKVHSLGKPVPVIEGLVAGTRLSPLIACSVDTGDRGFLSSFVEQWHRETSSFHLPVGEVTITLNDVSSLLHLPVVGDLHAFQPLHVDDAVQMLVDLLMISTEDARAEIMQCCTLFANKSATNVHVVFLEALRDLSQTERYAWGVAALVHMYDHLNNASINTSRQLGGYIMLLQCWIYEVFPSVVESTADPDYDEDSPHACRWIATKTTVKSILTPAYRERLYRLRIPNPRVILRVPETDIPHVPEPREPSTSARPAVDEPRHAVEVCYGIVERLEHHLSLGVVTPGSSTHEVIEECLRMVRSVTQDQLVYVRSQRRRYTDQA